MMQHIRFTLILVILLGCYLFSFPLCKNQSNKKNQDVSPDIQILFYSNLNGNIENCGCGDPPLGGLSRIISLVRELKKNDPDALFIDGGDFCNTYPFPELNQCVLQIYDYYPPDILVTGDQEFIQGLPFVKDFLVKHNKQMIGTNLVMNNQTIQSFKQINIKGNEILVAGILDPSAFMFVRKDKMIDFNQIRFEKIYQKLRTDQILIVIFHGSEDALFKFRTTFPAITLILFSHEQSKMVMDDSTPFVVGGGADGEFINHISLTKSSGNYILQNTRKPVGNKFQPDQRIEEIIQSYKSQLK